MSLSDFWPLPAFDGCHIIDGVADNTTYYPLSIPSLSNLDDVFPQFPSAGGPVSRLENWDIDPRSYYFQSGHLETESIVLAPTQAPGFSSIYPSEIQTYQTPLPPFAPASLHDHQTWSQPASVKGCTFRGRDQHVVTRRRKRVAKEICLACNGLDFTVKRLLENHIMAAHLGMRFSCPIEGCGKNYSHMSSLGRHIRDKHRGMMQDYVGTLT